MVCCDSTGISSCSGFHYFKYLFRLILVKFKVKVTKYSPTSDMPLNIYQILNNCYLNSFLTASGTIVSQCYPLRLHWETKGGRSSSSLILIPENHHILSDITHLRVCKGRQDLFQESRGTGRTKAYT